MNTYEKSVMNISRDDVDWFQVCRRLAYKDPGLFNDIISELSDTLYVAEDHLDQEISDMLKYMGYTNTIKKVQRDKGGLLKEAKDLVDSVMERMNG